MATHSIDVSSGAPSRDGDVHVELQFRPTARAISVMRVFLSDLLVDVLQEAEDAWRVALAAHELVENAARHSVDGEVGVYIDVVREQDAPVLTVRIKNRAAAEQRESLQMHLRELEAATDALEHYLSVMRRTAHRESGLGLARVRAEADMLVSGAFEGDEVCIKARTPVALRRAKA